MATPSSFRQRLPSGSDDSLTFAQCCSFITTTICECITRCDYVKAAVGTNVTTCGRVSWAQQDGGVKRQRTVVMPTAGRRRLPF